MGERSTLISGDDDDKSFLPKNGFLALFSMEKSRPSLLLSESPSMCCWRRFLLLFLESKDMASFSKTGLIILLLSWGGAVLFFGGVNSSFKSLL